MVYRHGSILGLAELSLAVGFRGVGSHSTEIRRIPKLLEEKRLLTGRTGDDTRIACCHLIESLAIGASDVYLGNEEGRKDARNCLAFLERILGCGKENMYGPAASAYAAICNHVIASDKEWHTIVTKEILDGITKSEFYECQRGFALAAGVCGNSPCLDEVVDVLCHELVNNVDVEVRRNSAISLSRLKQSILSSRLVPILRALNQGIQDYAKDERGDVGSWVREESMKGVALVVAKVLELRCSDHCIVFDPQDESTLIRTIQCISEQCCSRIDRTRAVAGASLRTICRLCSSNPVGDNLRKLCDTISSKLHLTSEGVEHESSEDVDFQETRTVFSRMKETLFIPDVFEPVLRGLVSAGGTSGQQSKPASKALAVFLSEATDLRHETINKLLEIIDQRDERLTLPALKLLESLLQMDGLRVFDEATLISVAKCVKRSWRQRLKDVKRVIAAVGALSELAILSETEGSFDFKEGTLGRECMEGLVVVLGGPIPRLRRVSAEALYLILLEIDADVEEADEKGSEEDMRVNVQKSLDILTETVWENMNMNEARVYRNNLCELLGIRVPVVTKKSQQPICKNAVVTSVS
ncbi:ARM repeat containing protein [Gracilaria domingensis]|nr:ARM repeat containing protein [Gracilaria domingensis]